jgi:ADP-ribose pyrophosphatase YjhB (NUDIX family)
MNSNIPLYQSDPDAWQQHLAEGNATQARKRVGVDALIRDERSRILLVDPTYKPGWDLPGGMVEANEAPEDALARELHEELGLDDVLIGPMVVVDWVPPHGVWDDSLMLIFDCGRLNLDQADALQPRDHELKSCRFVSSAEANELLPTRLARRLLAALSACETHATDYLRDGVAPG